MSDPKKDDDLTRKLGALWENKGLEGKKGTEDYVDRDPTLEALDHGLLRSTEQGWSSRHDGSYRSRFQARRGGGRRR